MNDLDYVFRRDRARLGLGPVEVTITKGPRPSPQIELKGLGVDLLLPIDDDTLNIMLSIFLGKYLPLLR